MNENKNFDDDFFGDILDNEPTSFENKIDDDIDFDFECGENQEVIDNEPIIEDIKPNKYVNKNSDTYKRTKNEIEDSVSELQGSINSMLKTIDKKPEDMYADSDLLPGLDIQIDNHDYEKDIQLIQIDAKETLVCLANLYLSEDMMKTKNVYKIIKDDAVLITKLNFSIECSQRMMISACKQVDMGVNDPAMFESISMFQKEMRDTVKMVYDIQRKMKDFYKELKGEMADINSGEEKFELNNEDNFTVVGDPKYLNNLMDQMKNDPNFMQNLLKTK